MEIPIYKAEELQYGNLVLVIIEPINTEGDIKVLEWGSVGFVPASSGLILVMEEKYVMQLDKFKLSMDAKFNPKLTLKQGEVFEEPEVSYYQQRKQELETEMKKLQNEEYRRENNLE